jgi:GT2 family glycosyltransferase
MTSNVALPPLDFRAPPVAIVIPVFNSPALVRRCIEAVLRFTRGARLILIDDASTDAAVTPLLAGYADRALVRVNPNNLGYTRSCNIGIELAGDADVVLLNSDTEVGPRWLQRLRLTAYAEANIGTVTAVSDNAGAFSVPEIEQYCPFPECWDLVQSQRALLQGAFGCLPELPTGNGFCMYVKRELLDRVGGLDADAFPAGYGEENDLCQRAARVGYRHLIAGDVLVRHARSASFGEERRRALGEQGMAALRARYPQYEADVGATLHSLERRVLEARVRGLYAAATIENAPRPRVLTLPTARRLESYEVFPWNDELARLDGPDLRDWLARSAIEAVHVDDISGVSPAVQAAARSADVEVVADAQGLAAVAPIRGVP